VIFIVLLLSHARAAYTLHKCREQICPHEPVEELVSIGRHARYELATMIVLAIVECVTAGAGAGAGSTQKAPMATQ
jgi:hypothetical protein